MWRYHGTMIIPVAYNLPGVLMMVLAGVAAILGTAVIDGLKLSFITPMQVAGLAMLAADLVLRLRGNHLRAHAQDAKETHIVTRLLHPRLGGHLMFFPVWAMPVVLQVAWWSAM